MPKYVCACNIKNSVYAAIVRKNVPKIISKTGIEPSNTLQMNSASSSQCSLFLQDSQQSEDINWPRDYCVLHPTYNRQNPIPVLFNVY